MTCHKTDSFKAFNFIEPVKKIMEKTGPFRAVFSVAVDVLSEKGYFLGSVSYTFLRFFQYLILRSRDFATSSIRNYAITTEIVTSGLYDDVGGSWIVLGLLHL